MKASRVPSRSSQTPREPRFPYDGKVRLLVPFTPWRLLLNLTGLNLSGTGLLALLPKDMRDHRSTPSAAKDVMGLLMPGDAYDLQLETDSEHATAPHLKARLVRTASSIYGHELAFSFEESDNSHASHWGLVHELEARCRAPH